MENIDSNNLPKHIAMIMDGNRRWAKNRGLETRDGHKAGADNLENIAKFCNKIGIACFLIPLYFTTSLLFLLNMVIIYSSLDCQRISIL